MTIPRFGLSNTTRVFDPFFSIDYNGESSTGAYVGMKCSIAVVNLNGFSWMSFYAAVTNFLIISVRVTGYFSNSAAGSITSPPNSEVSSLPRAAYPPSDNFTMKSCSKFFIAYMSLFCCQNVYLTLVKCIGAILFDE